MHIDRIWGNQTGYLSINCNCGAKNELSAPKMRPELAAEGLRFRKHCLKLVLKVMGYPSSLSIIHYDLILASQYMNAI